MKISQTFSGFIRSSSSGNSGCNNIDVALFTTASSVNSHYNCFQVWENPGFTGKSERIAPGFLLDELRRRGF